MFYANCVFSFRIQTLVNGDLVQKTTSSTTELSEEARYAASTVTAVPEAVTMSMLPWPSTS